MQVIPQIEAENSTLLKRVWTCLDILGIADEPGGGLVVGWMVAWDYIPPKWFIALLLCDNFNVLHLFLCMLVDALGSVLPNLQICSLQHEVISSCIKFDIFI